MTGFTDPGAGASGRCCCAGFFVVFSHSAMSRASTRLARYQGRPRRVRTGPTPTTYRRRTAATSDSGRRRACGAELTDRRHLGAIGVYEPKRPQRVIAVLNAADPHHLQHRHVADRCAVLWHPYLHGPAYSTTRDETRSTTTHSVTTTREQQPQPPCRHYELTWKEAQTSSVNGTCDVPS